MVSEPKNKGVNRPLLVSDSLLRVCVCGGDRGVGRKGGAVLSGQYGNDRKLLYLDIIPEKKYR